jgi:ATP adenylyltransferase
MTLEHLWAGWRQEYVAAASKEESNKSSEECVFCRILASGAPSAENGIVWRDALTAVILNAYPYATGHVLVMPVRHLGGLEELTKEESSSLWATTTTAVGKLVSVYDPDGSNVGANLGRAAGAGIPSHLHLHALPRWAGDTNFMTAIAGVRVMPESLSQTLEKLHSAW